jgi:RNA polymerase sigma factor (sigma-70 family)
MATAQLGTLLGHLQKLTAERCARQRTDRQLLEDFAACHDETAFAALVARHGPMVLRVCRRVLGHEQDAEDAFQATFLVLARCTASIRKREALPGWLYGVAYRTALKAKRGAARRRNHEARLRTLTPGFAPGPRWDDVQTALDEEIEGLPGHYRTAFVLCAVEGKTVPEAAAELGVKENTLASRLLRARRLLQSRLARRGIKLAALLASLAVAESASQGAVPASLARATVRFGLLVAAGEPAAAIPTHVAALAAGVTRTMIPSNLKIAAAVLLAAGLLAGAAVLAEPRTTTDPGVTPPAAPDARPAADDAHALAYGGRVLGPDGRPVAGARLSLMPSWGYLDRPAPSPVYATTGPDGRFRFRVPRSRFGNYQTSALAATAPGRGVGWLDVDLRDRRDDLTVRLVPDDSPVAGQVVDLQGRPIPGVSIRVLDVKAAPGDDLRPWLAAVRGKQGRSPELEERYFPRRLRSAEVPDLPRKAVTDADGRFRLGGLGRNRLVTVRISGPAITTQELHVLTRPGRPIEVPETTFAADGRPASVTTYYPADFRQVTAPPRLITGVVRDRDTKKPLAGFTVQGYRMASNPLSGLNLVRTTTDAQGRYRLKGMPKGAGNQIVVVPPGDQPYVAVHADVPDGPGFEPVTVDVELKRGVWIEGKITDKAAGKPLPGAVSYFALLRNPHLGDYPGFDGTFEFNRVVAKEDGSYRLVGLPGPGLVVVQHGTPYLRSAERDDALGSADPVVGTAPFILAGMSTNALARIDPAPGTERLTRDVTLDPGLTFHGTLVGPDGKPLRGVRTYGLRGDDGWERPALPTAEFTVQAFNPRRPRPVLFRHLETGLVGTFAPPADPGRPVTVRLQPGAAVTGRLLDADGRPRAGVKLDLSIRAHGKSWDGYSLPDQPIRTDADGRFRLGTLLPGSRFELYDPQGAYRFGDGLRPGETKDLGDVQLRPPAED